MKKYVKLCIDMMIAIEMGEIRLEDGTYQLGQGLEIDYCPWCGDKLVNWEKLADEKPEREE